MVEDSSPAISPDGRLLAFVRQLRDTQNQLFVLPLSESFQPAGSLRRLPTREHQWLKDPVWTADGRDVIYFAYNTALTAGGLWRVAPSGLSPAKPLSIAGAVGDLPAISGRGNCLAYRVSRFDYDIWRIDISRLGEPGTPRNLITSTLLDFSPQYSPDGKKIAFTSARSGVFEIWLSEQDGSKPRQLTFLKATNTARPIWFPDGRRIIFSSNKDGMPDLYVIDTNDGSLRRLTDHPARDVMPSVSQDGKRVYFASNRSGSWQIWRIPIDGGQAVQVTREGGYSPVESADGRFLFYLGGSASTISRMSLKEGTTAQLFGGLIGNNNFAVTKNGIGFVGTGEGGKPSMQFYAFATGNIRTIIDLENSLYRGVSISPDGQSILYSQRNKGDSDLMLVENFQ
jgi:Tol biopolymer transport system component